MKSFIRKIFDREVDEFSHKQFTRFGKGKYEGRALLKLWKTDKIKISGSYEYANDFVLLACELADELNISGVLLSKEDISLLFRQKGINAVSEEKKGGLFYKNNIDEQKVSSENLKEIIKKSYYCLLDGQGFGIELKIKKNMPKPGKSGKAKMDDKFCQFEADLKFWPKIKEAFFWDIEGKKFQISHDFLIENLKFPEGEKDFEKIRLMAKRIGKIIRRTIVDGKEQVKEAGFEA